MIHLLPLEPVVAEIIPSLVTPLQMLYRTEVIVEPANTVIMRRVFDDSRGQYNSTETLRHMLALPSAQQKEKLLGITSVDLFVPVLTYVFGEAQLDGTAALISTFRLDNLVYGLPADPVNFFERVLKEAVHELGHAYGLYHCRNLECAMHASSAVEDIDTKGAGLCDTCRTTVVR